MKIYQVLEGLHNHIVNAAGNCQLDGHTGSVTFIKSADKKILIDTGSRAAWPKVKQNLATLGVMPEDIDYVFLTHFHLDHCFNVAYFSQARVFGFCQEWSETATIELGQDLNKTSLSGVLPFIESIRTPGHDECLNSFFVTGAESLTLLNKEVIDLTEKVLCVSGDAINEKVIASGGLSLPYTYDKSLYKQSAQAILSKNPDFILPGHGALIARPGATWPQVA